MARRFKKVLGLINHVIYAIPSLAESFYISLKANEKECRNVSTDCLPDDNKHVDILVVAFNDARLIAEQLRLVRLYCTDADYSYVVVDNSPVAEARNEIRRLCERENLTYIAIPRSTRFLNLGKRCISHAIALNTAYYQYIRKCRPHIFGFIDHDIFPQRPFSIIDKVGEQPFMGCRREALGTSAKYGHKKLWYLWPGYAFFKYAPTHDKRINFMPIHNSEIFLDTGGSLYPQLYAHYEPGSLRFADEEVVRVRQSEGLRRNIDVFLTDCINMIDGREWLHLINGSNTAPTTHKNDKAEMLKEYMERIKSIGAE